MRAQRQQSGACGFLRAQLVISRHLCLHTTSSQSAVAAPLCCSAAPEGICTLSAGLPLRSTPSPTAATSFPDLSSPTTPTQLLVGGQRGVVWEGMAASFLQLHSRATKGINGNGNQEGQDISLDNRTVTCTARTTELCPSVAIGGLAWEYSGGKGSHLDTHSYALSQAALPPIPLFLPSCSQPRPLPSCPPCAPAVMGIFDRLRGRRPEPAEQDSAAAAAAASVDPSLDLGASQKEALRDPSRTISTEVTPGVSFRTEEQARLYNPYEGLGAALDRSRGSTTAFKLPSQPEFLFSEEALVRKRSWSENLTYYTGMGYLGGALMGGGRGAYQAVISPVAVVGVDTTRLRVNQLLNTSGKLGRSAGNALGVLGLFFASFESLLGYLSDSRVPDEVVTLGAGAATGALFRSVRGSRQAAVAGALGTAGAGLLLAGRRYINRGL